MKKVSVLSFLTAVLCVGFSPVTAQNMTDLSVAPQAPEFVLPDEPAAPVSVKPQPAPSVLAEPAPTAAPKAPRRRTVKQTPPPASYESNIPAVKTPDVAQADLLPEQELQPVAMPQELLAQVPAPVRAQPMDSAPMPYTEEADYAEMGVMPGKGDMMMPDAQAAVVDAVAAAPVTPTVQKIFYNPQSKKDPTLSPDEVLLVKLYQEQRRQREEAERQRKLEAERRRAADLERMRQLELARLKDPAMEVRGLIRVGGIIGQEVFIGNRIYTVGKSIYGAKIVKVLPESVVFMYKGHKFTKKVELK